jgi:DNA-binding transcriptional ArsR family regulator
VTERVRSYDEEVWLAVADPSRRSLLELLIHRDEATASGLASEVPFTRQAVSKHLVILEKARLVTSRRQGREVLYSIQSDQVERAAQLLLRVGTAWDSRLQSIKRISEAVHRTSENTQKPDNPS